VVFKGFSGFLGCKTAKNLYAKVPMLSIQIRSRDLFQIWKSLFNKCAIRLTNTKNMFKKNKNCLGNCSLKTPYFSKFSSTYCSYVHLLYSVLVIFAQFNDVLKRIEQAKTVHICLLKGVTVPDVLCLTGVMTGAVFGRCSFRSPAIPAVCYCNCDLLS
jgi:hypothetical protein